MKLSIRFMACVCIAFCLAGISYAKEWRGIVPFQSTRTEVEKLLGKPPPPPSDGTRIYTPNKKRSIYFLDEGEIYIVYAEDDNFSVTEDCLDAVPAGTVLLIKITPKKELKLADLNLNLKKFKKFDPAKPKGFGYEGYFDETEGLLIRAFKEKVEEITYLPTASERPKCPYYKNPESFIQIMICGLGAY